MRAIDRLVGAAGLALASGFVVMQPTWAAEPLQVHACPTRDKAEQQQQSKGALTPDGCRTLTVTRVDSSAGAMCLIKFGDAPAGILGTITDAVTTTEWWTACGNIHSP